MPLTCSSWTGSTSVRCGLRRRRAFHSSTPFLSSSTCSVLATAALSSLEEAIALGGNERCNQSGGARVLRCQRFPQPDAWSDPQSDRIERPRSSHQADLFEIIYAPPLGGFPD
jgi:hypothetical protein